MKYFRSFASDDRIRLRAGALCSQFRKTDVILSGKKDISVRILDSTVRGIPAVLRNAPGFSTEDTIYINLDKFMSKFNEPATLVRLLGLNYHELSHILYTPGTASWLKTTVVVENMQKTMNALEDQRIEALFTAKYPSTAKYFTEMVIEFLVGDENTWPFAHALTWGRRFLPLEIRKEFQARFADQIYRETLEVLIDEYLTLVPSGASFEMGDDQRMFDVIKDVHAILENVAASLGNHMPDKDCSAAKRGSSSQASSSEQKSVAKQAKEKRDEQDAKEAETEEDQSGFFDDVPLEEDEEEDKENGEGDGTGSGEEDSDEEHDDSSEDSDGGQASGDDDSDDDDGEGESDGSVEDGEHGDSQDDKDEDGEPGTTGSGGSGAGVGVVEDFTDEELLDFLEEVLAAVEESEQVQNDLKRISAAINDPDLLDVEGSREQGNPIDALPEDAHVARTLGREFQRLYAEVEPGWKYGQDSGRLNINRVITDPDDFESHFDEWDEGREQEVGLEVNLAIDLSGSMNGSEIALASRALWVLKRALDDVDAVTSVLGFGDHTRVLYGRQDKVDRNRVHSYAATDGSTEPVVAMKQARRIMANTNRPNKLWVILTDGAWQGTDDETGHILSSYEISDLINTIDATRMFVGINARNNYQEAFHISKTIKDPMDLVPMVNAVVKQMIREAQRVGGRR